MCYYMPNKPPCTCTYLQLIQPCPEVRLLTVPGNPTPLIQVCPIRYIARGVGQRFCALCSGSLGPGVSGAVGLVGYPEQQQGFRASPSQQAQQQQQQQAAPMPLDPCLVGEGISIGDLLLLVGEERTGPLDTEIEAGTAVDEGRRDEAGRSVQGSCASASSASIQSLLVQDSVGGGSVADGCGAQVDGVWMVQAVPVEEEGSKRGDEAMRGDENGHEVVDHVKEIGGPDPKGRASVQGMQIVVDLEEKSSEER